MHDVFFFTDIHGQWNLYNTIINYCKEQDSECTIVFGGDAADRGPDGYKIIKHLLSDPHIIYLYGNHEDLFIRAADAIIGAYAINDELYEFLHNCDEQRARLIVKNMKSRGNEDILLHLANNGESTLIDWLCDEANEEIIDKLRALPYTFSYKNIDMCHAGGSYTTFKNAADAEYNGTYPTWYDRQILIWDRNGIPLGWETGRICIHGHTPVLFLPRRVLNENKVDEKNIHPCSWYDLMGARDKRGGLKINMDTAATFLGRAYVLNLLTMKTIGFYDPSVKKEEGEIKVIEEYKINLG